MKKSNKNNKNSKEVAKNYNTIVLSNYKRVLSKKQLNQSFHIVIQTVK